MRYGNVEVGQTFQINTGKKFLKLSEYFVLTQGLELGQSMFHEGSEVTFVNEPEEMLFVVTGSQMKTCEG